MATPYIIIAAISLILIYLPKSDKSYVLPCLVIFMTIIACAQIIYWLGFRDEAANYYYINLEGDENKIGFVSGVKHHIVLYISLFLQFRLYARFFEMMNEGCNGLLTISPILKWPVIVLLIDIGVCLSLLLIGELIEIQLLNDSTNPIALIIAIIAVIIAFLYGIYHTFKTNIDALSSRSKGVLFTLFSCFYFSAMILAVIYSLIGVLKLILIVVLVVISLAFLSLWAHSREVVVIN